MIPFSHVFHMINLILYDSLSRMILFFFFIEKHLILFIINTFYMIRPWSVRFIHALVIHLFAHDSFFTCDSSYELHSFLTILFLKILLFLTHDIFHMIYLCTFMIFLNYMIHPFSCDLFLSVLFFPVHFPLTWFTYFLHNLLLFTIHISAHELFN